MKPQEAPAEVVPENKELRGLGLFMGLDRLLDAMIRVFPCLAWLLFWERFWYTHHKQKGPPFPPLLIFIIAGSILFTILVTIQTTVAHRETDNNYYYDDNCDNNIKNSNDKNKKNTIY